MEALASSSSSSSSSAPRRRSVSFNTSDSVVYPIDCCCSTPEQASELWFTSDEYKHIRRRNKLVIQMARSGGFRETDQTTLLGLEKQTAAAKFQRKVARSHLMQRFGSSTSRCQ